MKLRDVRSQQSNYERPGRLGDLVRRAREEMGLSARQLALRVGIHHANLRRMETGDQRPAPETLQRLAMVLDLDEADLLALTGYRLPERLPTFPAYLRAKYRMPDEAARQLSNHFAYLAIRYDVKERPISRNIQTPTERKRRSKGTN